MTEVKVKFKRFSHNAIIPYKTHETDFCYDVVATSKEEISEGVFKYGLGFGLQVAPTDISHRALVSFDLRPRSSIHKTGLVLSNGIGTIDQGYTGEISAVFYHVMKDLPEYNVGDKIAQLHLSVSVNVDFVTVKEFFETDRGSGGYGSTDFNNKNK